MISPTFFYLSLHFTIRSSWSEPQSTPSLVFSECIELLHLQLQRFDFGIGHLMMSMDRVISWVAGKECLLWPACFLDKILLAFALLHFVIQGHTCLLLQVSLDLLLLHFSSLWWKGHFFQGLVLEGVVGLHRTVQLLHHYWLGHRLGLQWYWMVCLGNEQRSFCHFWDCIQVLHFRLLLTMTATPFLLRDHFPLY